MNLSLAAMGIDADAALDANTRENVRLSFDEKVEGVIQEIVETNFDLYKRITDDPAFGAVLKDFLFEQYLQGRQAPEQLPQG